MISAIGKSKVRWAVKEDVGWSGELGGGGVQFKIGWSEEENKMAEEWVDVEHISLHRYIRNTPSDTEVHAEHQLRADTSTRPTEKNVSDQISHSVVSDSLRPHESQHARPPCPSPTPGIH